MVEPAEFSLFAGVDSGEVPKLLARFDAHEESFEKGELLFREGDVPHEVGLVLSGALHVMQDDFWGNASIVSEVGEGDLFGASSACDPVPALDTHGLALAPTRALYLDTGRILNPPPGAPACHVRALANFARMLAGKYAVLNRKIAHTAKRTTRGKVLSYLSEQAALAGSDLFAIPFNRQQLADYLEVDRAALSKVLARMRVEGVIDFDRSTFRLLKP